MYLPADAERVDPEQGFGSNDPWPALALHRAHRSRGVGRGLILMAVVLGGIVSLLGLIQLFSLWFGPCFHGAC